MKADRDTSKLHPRVELAYANLKKLAALIGIDFLITEGWRSGDRQDWLFAQGRTRPGAIVTQAPRGKSSHENTVDGRPASLAFDVAFVSRRGDNGKVLAVTYDGPWNALAGIAKDMCGLKWGGDWRRPVDKPHFYMEA